MKRNTKRVTTILTNPDNKKIEVDIELKDEIIDLWDRGIRTTGCCSGHAAHLPYIGVVDEDIQKMFDLGYNLHINTCSMEDMNRLDSFIPKSIKISQLMWQDYIKELQSNKTKFIEIETIENNRIFISFDKIIGIKDTHEDKENYNTIIQVDECDYKTKDFYNDIVSKIRKVEMQ